jgi:hypothetical protein
VSEISQPIQRPKAKNVTSICDLKHNLLHVILLSVQFSGFDAPTPLTSLPLYGIRLALSDQREQDFFKLCDGPIFLALLISLRNPWVMDALISCSVPSCSPADTQLYHA